MLFRSDSDTYDPQKQKLRTEPGLFCVWDATKAYSKCASARMWITNAGTITIARMAAMVVELPAVDLLSDIGTPVRSSVLSGRQREASPAVPQGHTSAKRRCKLKSVHAAGRAGVAINAEADRCASARLRRTDRCPMAARSERKCSSMVIRSVRTGAARKRARTAVSDAGDDIDLGLFSDAIGFYLRTAQIGRAHV